MADQQRRGRLSGKVIVLDPGHQLGNSRHPHEINRLVDAGGFMKACNTTGTSTNGGYPEATFAWRVAQALKRQLRSHGATVYLTRHTNSYADWGPCIDVRGRKGNRVHADAAISLHGDGAASDVRGFFVIRPSDRPGWTSDIYRVSHRFAQRVKGGLVRAGVRVSNAYGGDGYDVRGDLGTLNWSNVPIVMVELANMRNSTDAGHITSAHYRKHRFARGLRWGIASFLRNR
jgi:N-acetylmuramoyl-L-alanine amidase